MHSESQEGPLGPGRTARRPSGARRARAAVACLAAALALPVALTPGVAGAAGPLLARAAAAQPVAAQPVTSVAPGGAAAVDTPEVRRLRERAAAAQKELVEATAAYAASERRLAEARVKAEEARRRAEVARAEAERLRAAVQDYAAAAYKGGVGNDFVLVLGVVTSGETRRFDRAEYVDRVRTNQNDDLEALTAAQRVADEQSRLAEGWLATAAKEEAELARRAEEVRSLSQAAAGELEAHLRVVDAALAAAAAEQAARSAGAVARWQAYLERLAAARVVPPPAAALADPAALPAGLRPLLVDGVPTPGVAEVTDAAGLPLLVLSAEAVDSVTRVLGEVGKAYRPGGRGPDGYDCGGLVTSVVGGLPTDPAGQFGVVAPVGRAAVQAGDLVFLGSEQIGLTSVGISLGQGEMVSASKATGSVQVAAVPQTGVLSFGRPTLAHRAPVAAPAARGGIECGGYDAPARSGRASGAWGGYPNGLIPTSALCALGAAPAHRLRCDAAAALDAMAVAYQAEMGEPICITDSYRSYPAQVDVYARKPGLAAVPGTSNHGWALAVDFCGGINIFGTPEHEWMRANAGAFGYVHPRWAQQGGSKPEAWHWEFGQL